PVVQINEPRLAPPAVPIGTRYQNAAPAMPTPNHPSCECRDKSGTAGGVKSACGTRRGDDYPPFVEPVELCQPIANGGDGYFIERAGFSVPRDEWHRASCASSSAWREPEQPAARARRPPGRGAARTVARRCRQFTSSYWGQFRCRARCDRLAV